MIWGLMQSPRHHGFVLRKTAATDKSTQELAQDDPRLCGLGVAHVPFACESLQEKGEGRGGVVNPCESSGGCTNRGLPSRRTRNGLRGIGTSTVQAPLKARRTRRRK